MSKAILVIDMPASCKQCRFRDVDGCSVDDCAKNNDGSLVIDRYIYDLKRHGSCPLKTIPTKEEIYERIYQAYGLGNDEIYKRIRQAVEDIYDEMIGEENG